MTAQKSPKAPRRSRKLFVCRGCAQQVALPPRTKWRARCDACRDVARHAHNAARNSRGRIAKAPTLAPMVCIACHRRKAAAEFAIDPRGRNGRRRTCRSCVNKAASEVAAELSYQRRRARAAWDVKIVEIRTRANEPR